jgi:alpha-D-ribose 1-methylphosphonate 5-triphosphate synthase subunit PhnG
MPVFPVAQSEYLGVLVRTPAADVKDFAETLIPLLEPIEVLVNRSGLVMLPMTEHAQGATFYLGEVLIAEAHVRVAHAEGYAACLGRDLEQALAIALLDVAIVAGVAHEAIAVFVAHHAALLKAADDALEADVAQTYVAMETF